MAAKTQPRWIFIKSNEDYKRKLHAASVNFVISGITVPKRALGIYFRETDIKKVQKILKLEINLDKKLPLRRTDWPGVYYLQLPSEKKSKQKSSAKEKARPVKKNNRQASAQGKNLQTKREQESNRRRYFDECQYRLKHEQDSLRKKLDDNLKRQVEYLEVLHQLWTEEPILQANLAGINNLSQDQDNLIVQEYNNLCHNPKIIKVEVESGKIIIYTKHLYTQPISDGTLRDLGKFKITLNASSGQIRIDNLTRTIGYSQHPHVYTSDQRPCLGNVGEGIHKLIAQNQFAVVMQIMIQYLETINEDSQCSSDIMDWPIKRQRQNKTKARAKK